jgi:hypothetical protein
VKIRIHDHAAETLIITIIPLSGVAGAHKMLVALTLVPDRLYSTWLWAGREIQADFELSWRFCIESS